MIKFEIKSNIAKPVIDTRNVIEKEEINTSDSNLVDLLCKLFDVK